MSKTLSLKLQDPIFEESEKIIKKLGQPRNAYFNAAINFYNQLYRRKLLRNVLVKESKTIYRNSLEVLKEFERFEDGLPE